MDIRAPEQQYNPYRIFSREQWAKLRDDTPMTLEPGEFERLRSMHDRLDLQEVEDIYLPLSRLLSIYVDATQRLYYAQRQFLGIQDRKMPYIIGVAGSVAAGKSTTARVLQALLARWSPRPKVDLITTDGFLMPNAALERQGLMQKKGFPESYDLQMLLSFLSDIKAGRRPVRAPVYSHLTYDIVPNNWVEIDLRPRRPSRQQCLEHARGGGFSDRDRSGDADDVGHLAVADVEELALRVIQALHRIDIDRQQARQRQVDVLDLLQVEAIVQRAQPVELARLQRHRRVVAQPRPFFARIDAVRIILLLGCADIHDATSPLD